MQTESSLKADLADVLTNAGRATNFESDFASFDALTATVEQTVMDEFATGMTCRVEISCNTSGVCEAKLVCTF